MVYGLWFMSENICNFDVVGVNRCSLHCCLAKIRGLMYRVKYSAVIGSQKPIACIFILGTYKKTRISTNHSAVFDHAHKTTEFRQNGSVNYSGRPLPLMGKLTREFRVPCLLSQEIFAWPL